MNLHTAIQHVLRRFEEAGIRHALIGGMAMALRGVHRATFDLDILLLIEDLDTAHRALESEGYVRTLQTENVSHYENAASLLDRIDLLHAFRIPSRRMLERAELIAFATDLGHPVPVLQSEDLIGLKLQALTNNPARALPDWNDVFQLVQHAARARQALDWERIEGYLELFKHAHKLPELKALYDAHRTE